MPKTKRCRIKCLDIFGFLFTLVSPFFMPLFVGSDTILKKIRSMEYYLQKTYYKTASLISNSCKAVAILAGHTAEISVLAYEYGRNLVRKTSLFSGIISPSDLIL